jgi:tetratricopeptide (TPR) repeat protein
VRKNLSNPDWEVVNKLSTGLFHSSDSGSKGYGATLYAALALKEWLLVNHHNVDGNFQRQETLTLARGHLEVWLVKGVAAEMYHLKRSRELYERYFEDYPDYSSAKDRVDYCKVLHFLGEWAAACAEIAQVVATHETDPNISNYLFYAGAIFKSAGDYERASTFFFEANECGPPRYFSQIEMMTVISRNLEVMNEDGEGEGDENEDAYRMVSARAACVLVCICECCVSSTLRE